MGSYFKFKNKYYISANSSLADDRTMVLKDGDSFGVFDRYGDVHPIGQGAQGLYCEGTRFVSMFELLVNGERPIMLSSSLKEENEMFTVDVTNPDFRDGEKVVLEKGTIHIHRSKFLWKNVCYEKISLSNFTPETQQVSLSLEIDSDFSDIFEVRGMARPKKGKKLKIKSLPGLLEYGYLGLDKIERRTKVHFQNVHPAINGNQAIYSLTLSSKSTLEIEIAIAFQIGSIVPEIITFDLAHERLLEKLKNGKEGSCNIITSNEQFNEWLNRSAFDLITMISETANGPYPYAGVPWYSTPFGRDGILTAWECLWLHPELTKGVLLYLAATQASELNKFQDAEPGKIFHEKRGGEMAELGEIPFKLYYGTIDATPLFISLAGAYYERTGDVDTIRRIWPNIERALDWIDNFGDIDGDGFVEYLRQSEKGLANQGWKDSHDSIFYEDGRLAEGSIALCEVQGYVYDAKVRAAFLAEELGLTDLSLRLREEAEVLKEKFAEAFWSEEKQTFVIALDGNKKQCKISTSNAGHCLFSGIVKPEHAGKLANTLLGEKLFSSWGIRTAATDEARYNPMSYHNGSVWPHDNAIIASGLARYGFYKEVHHVLEGLFEVTKFVEAYRLPELFCGFNKRKNEGPTAYPVACSPQAWSVASVYLLIQATLGLRISARENTVYFYQPTLPHFLQEITIANLKVNDSKIVVQIRRNNDDTAIIHVLHKEGNAEVKVVEGVLEEVY